ncbi:hypothetical protein J6590_101688, partial [Homalodisca vitripennis]
KVSKPKSSFSTDWRRAAAEYAIILLHASNSPFLSNWSLDHVVRNLFTRGATVTVATAYRPSTMQPPDRATSDYYRPTRWSVQGSHIFLNYNRISRRGAFVVRGIVTHQLFSAQVAHSLPSRSVAVPSQMKPKASEEVFLNLKPGDLRIAK